MPSQFGERFGHLLKTWRIELILVVSDSSKLQYCAVSFIDIPASGGGRQLSGALSLDPPGCLQGCLYFICYWKSLGLVRGKLLPYLTW